MPAAKKHTQTPLKARPKGKSPWKRGPAAYGVALMAPDLLEEMAGIVQTHLSLRETARLLCISTQPLREWHRDGWIRKGPKGLKFPVEEIRRFVLHLQRYAKPYDMRGRYGRFHLKRGKDQPLPGAWSKLKKAEIQWPKGKDDLTPH